MLNHLFNSVFSQASLSVDPLMLLASLMVSLLLGFVLAALYKYRTVYSKEFVITLTVLPSLIAVIIFLVNGNLGTSVAVAGTFSLIKFRSPASSAKELLLVFMATAIGLATGMGYLSLAVVVSVLIAVIIWGLERQPLTSQPQLRQLTLKLPADLANLPSLKHHLEQVCPQVDLLSLKRQKGWLELVYQIQLASSEANVVTHLLAYDEQLELSLSRLSSKKKAL